LLGISIYGLLVGFEAPTARALVMGSISLFAVLFGRQTQALYALVLSCLAILLAQPENLFDISFQLTVSATLGIILFTNTLDRSLKKVPSLFRGTLATTLAAQIFVVPLIFYYFHNVSIMSPLVNTLILWTIPAATILGFLILIISFISLAAASLFSTLVYIPLKAFYLIVDLFSRLDFLLLRFEEANLFVVLGYYVLVVAFWLGYRKRKSIEVVDGK
jgi:competence protein ComEC